jgi:two-component system vancomycin resistance associated response regulator VraR
MPKSRVMIVDDQRLVRQYFELVLADSERYEVVHSIESAAFADTYVLRGGVDIALIDVLMNDGSNGLEAACRIKRANPKVKIVLVTSVPEFSWMDRAREAGVESFWYKDADATTILEVMDRTMAGESVYPQVAPAVTVGLAKSDEFTTRELEILRAVVEGLTNEQIGERLHLSDSTVKTHMRHLLEKTGCENRTKLAVLARVSGLVVDAI